MIDLYVVKTNGDHKISEPIHAEIGFGTVGRNIVILVLILVDGENLVD